MNIGKQIIGICIVGILSFWSVKPLTESGYFPMHDDTQVGRVVAMGKALRQGQFPVRWVTDLGYGYGYPIFNFYGPLPYYVGGFLYTLGFWGVDATKMMMLVGVVGAAFSMYALLAPTFGVVSGIVAATLYLYAPYHAVQLYVRGAVGEIWAYAFLPIVIMGIIQILGGNKRTGSLVGGLGLACVIVAHTIIGFISVVAVGALIVCSLFYIYVSRKSAGSSVWPHVYMLIIGLSLSAFFWLPAITEMGYTNVGSQIGNTAYYKDHFVCLYQLWDSPWGFGGSSPSCVDGISYRLGKLHILVAVVGMALWIIKGNKSKHRSVHVFMLVGIIVCAASVFFMTDVSGPVWQIAIGFAYIQYPWRFLSVAMFGLVLMGGVGYSMLPPIIRHVYAFVVIIACVLTYAKLFVPQTSFQRHPSEFETIQELRFRVSKISDEYLSSEFPRPTKISEIPARLIPESPYYTAEIQLDGDIVTKSFITTSKDQVVTIQRAHFPGWHYYLDGVEVYPQGRGLPQFTIPAGRHSLESIFVDTPSRSVGNIISILTLLFLISFYGNKKIVS